VGAIYLDRGYNYCYRFLEEQVFEKHINIDTIARQERNFKSTLIEWCQKYQYKFEFQQRQSHEGRYNTPVFHASVLVEGIPCGTGDGYSKKESDQQAAKQALKRIKTDKELMNGIKNAKSKGRIKKKPEEESPQE
jgi:ribonuclease-3